MSNVLDRNLALGMLAAMFILAIAPALFPPRRSEYGLPESVKQLLAQYIYGAGALLVGQVVWLALVERSLRPIEIGTGLAVITAAGGLTVMARYASMWAKCLWVKYFKAKTKAARLEDVRQGD